MATDRLAGGLERRLLQALRRAGVAARSARIVVAVSGGVDSTALLLGLSALSASGRVTLALFPCHVDHGLRAAPERQAEQARLAVFCAALGLPLDARMADVAAERRRVRLSPEAAARRARYRALGEAAAATAADWVVTGHTADDQAETVLLRLLGGTGLRGLRAMSAASRPWGETGPSLLRPLLSATRADTMAYCRARGVGWSEDSSNASPAFRRNRLRHEALPLLEAISPGAAASLNRLAGQAEAFAGWLDAEVARWLEALWVEADDAWLLRRPSSSPPPFIAAGVAAGALARLLERPGAPGERQVRALVDLWQGAAGRRLTLGAGWQAEAASAGVRFTRRRPEPAAGAPPGSAAWALPLGETGVPGWRVRVTRDVAAQPADPLAGGSLPHPHGAGFCAHVAERTLSRLSVRFWRPGDRLRPAGLGGSKKLQDIFVDEKVPRLERARIPLLFADDVCIWVVGVKRAAEAAGRPVAGGDTVRIEFERSPETDT